MSVLLTMWAWFQTRLATARHGEDGWGAVEWMVIMVFVVFLRAKSNGCQHEHDQQHTWAGSVKAPPEPIWI